MGFFVKKENYSVLNKREFMGGGYKNLVDKKDLIFPMCAKSWSFYFLTSCFVNKWVFLNWG